MTGEYAAFALLAGMTFILTVSALAAAAAFFGGYCGVKKAFGSVSKKSEREGCGEAEAHRMKQLEALIAYDGGIRSSENREDE